MRKYTLSQFKRDMKEGRTFEILEHYVKPELKGCIRKANIMQTNGMYTKNINEPDNSEWNNFNGGKGGWTEFGKASYYEFNDNFIIRYFDETHKTPMFKFKML